VIYLYAITWSRCGTPEGAGLEGSPLFAVRFEDLVAVCSRHHAGELRARPETLWRHDDVVERTRLRGPTLPIRFGSTFPDERAAMEALPGRADAFRAQLERVEGCVELAVRVGIPGTSGPPREEGGAFLRARLERQREMRAAAERALPPLDELAVACRRGEPPADRRCLTASYLVRQSDVEQFVREVRRIARTPAGEAGELSVSCTGPWAPYSFVGEETR